jgi:mono/diheme cytochrome c family protein
MNTKVLAWFLAGTLAVACTDDEEDRDAPVADAGAADSGADGGGARDASMDATVLLDGGGQQPDASAPDAATPLALRIERGRYLVENIAACSDCHTPRNPDGSFKTELAMSGADCFADAFPEDDTRGCLSSRNLTNHETGLKNRSDAEIKDMLTKGQRPDGKYLHPVMPYWTLGNMSAADVDAMIAFLRTLAPVDHMVKPAQFPFADVPAPAPLWPDALIPQPRPDYPEQQAALRGRYLAGSIGVCMECHSPRTEMDVPIFERAFEGARAFPRADLGLPPVFPDVIYTSNLTPDATGIQGYDVSKIVAALKKGVDKDNKGLCPPMPAGPMAAFGGITDADATDIAHYLLSLPPKVNMLPNQCTPPGAP